jgi:RNA polymerase-binding transcription factor DksA
MLTQPNRNATRQHLQALLLRLDRERAGLSAEAFGRDHEQGSGWEVTRRPDEEGSVRLEDEVTLGLLEHEDMLVAQINAALECLDRGTYGACTRCGRPISAQRLHAMPYATDCIGCARRIAPNGGRC